MSSGLATSSSGTLPSPPLSLSMRVSSLSPLLCCTVVVFGSEEDLLERSIDTIKGSSSLVQTTPSPSSTSMALFLPDN